jgi:hypothetical protein
MAVDGQDMTDSVGLFTVKEPKFRRNETKKIFLGEIVCALQI